eukprot:14599528-Alexandrium_andersonii.AAC.1
MSPARRGLRLPLSSRGPAEKRWSARPRRFDGCGAAASTAQEMLGAGQGARPPGLRPLGAARCCAAAMGLGLGRCGLD